MRLLVLAALLVTSPLGAQDSVRRGPSGRDSAIIAVVIRAMPGDTAYIKALFVHGDTATVSVARFRTPRPGEQATLLEYSVQLVKRGDDWVAAGEPRYEAAGVITGPPKRPR